MKAVKSYVGVANTLPTTIILITNNACLNCNEYYLRQRGKQAKRKTCFPKELRIVFSLDDNMPALHLQSVQ